MPAIRVSVRRTHAPKKVLYVLFARALDAAASVSAVDRETQLCRHEWWRISNFDPLFFSCKIKAILCLRRWLYSLCNSTSGARSILGERRRRRQQEGGSSRYQFAIAMHSARCWRSYLFVVMRYIVYTPNSWHITFFIGPSDILDYFIWSKNGVPLPDRSSTALQSRFIIQSDFSLLYVHSYWQNSRMSNSPNRRWFKRNLHLMVFCVQDRRSGRRWRRQLFVRCPVAASKDHWLLRPGRRCVNRRKYGNEFYCDRQFRPVIGGTPFFCVCQ